MKIQYKSYKKEVLDKLRVAEIQALELVGEAVRSAMVKQITVNNSVDTGLMRNSCDYVVNKKKTATYKADKGGGTSGVEHDNRRYTKNEYSVVVGNPVEYASSVESKKPFMKPAMNTTAMKVKQIMEKVIRSAMK